MIRKLLNRVINWAQNCGRITLIDNDVVSTSRDSSIGAQGMTFTLYSASGGHIVEYRSYDTKSDERINNLHIITNDQDIGERIGQIVTMELLRKH
jgi:hypothetical protein